MTKTKERKRAAVLAPHEMNDAVKSESVVPEEMLRSGERRHLSGLKLAGMGCGLVMLLGIFGVGIYVIVDSNNFEHYRADQTQILEKAKM